MEDKSLVLAAEDFDSQEFKNYHYFTSQDKKSLLKLRAHGPVLLKGSRGSGKTALMIEAHNGLFPKNSGSKAIGIYISLRHLDILRSSGAEYTRLLCRLVAKEVNLQLGDEVLDTDIENVTELQNELIDLVSGYKKRVVLLFDDAAHIGRETSLNEFFDLFRTLSNNYISCKASTHPGVTKFETRLDAYGDVTVIDVCRSENSHDFPMLFEQVINKRFPVSLDDSKFDGSLTKTDACKLMGQAVLGNIRAFLFACNQLIILLKQNDKVTYNHLSESFKQLATNYFWPLLEEIEPKLGKYQPMVKPAEELACLFFKKAGLKSERSVLILKEINQRLIKPLEILECAGFILRREVSKAMKSRGRGTRYVLNLCNIAEYLDKGRLTESIAAKWRNGQDDSIEYHRSSELFKIELPEPSEEYDLDILNMSIEALVKSDVYPYGLTTNMIEILKSNDIKTIEDLISKTDDELQAIHNIGGQTVKKLRSTVNQAIWM